MDIGKLVTYEQLYTLHVKNPGTGEPLGITFQIRSASSAAAKEVLMKHINDNYERQQQGQPIQATQRLKEELEKAASYIASWDWGENTYQGEKPELTMDKAIAILDKEGWLFNQVVRAANAITNFMPASANISAST